MRALDQVKNEGKWRGCAQAGRLLIVKFVKERKSNDAMHYCTIKRNHGQRYTIDEACSLVGHDRQNKEEGLTRAS